MKKLFLTILAIFIFSFAANAQLRAYTFQYNDEFGGKQKCYLTLRSIVAEWDDAKLTVLFNCNETAAVREKGVAPRKIFVMTLSGADFLTSVMVNIQSNEAGSPRALALSNWAWDTAETTDFIDDYAYDETKKQMVSTKKSLNDLSAVKINVPLQ